MITTFTPGPWQRVDNEDYAEIHPADHRLKSPIALVGRPSDADLIAAAPDMFEALARLEWLTPAAANASSALDLHLTVNAIAATALSKAKGETL